MDDKKKQQKFLQFLIQVSKAKSQEELDKFIKQVGEEGMKKLMMEFEKAESQGKMNYLKGLE